MTISVSKGGLNVSNGLSVWTDWVIEETSHTLLAFQPPHLCLFISWGWGG